MVWVTCESLGRKKKKKKVCAYTTNQQAHRSYFSLRELLKLFPKFEVERTNLHNPQAP